MFFLNKKTYINEHVILHFLKHIVSLIPHKKIMIKHFEFYLVQEMR